jgi:hypothetical protein
MAASNDAERSAARERGTTRDGGNGFFAGINEVGMFLAGLWVVAYS